MSSFAGLRENALTECPFASAFNSHPEIRDAFPLGIAPQEYICFAMLALIALASWLALRPR